MPILTQSTYKPNALFKYPHLNTIFPVIFRKVENIIYTRERILTLDNDFIDLDFSKVNSKKLVIVLHGLESNSHEYYVKGIIKAFNNIGWDGMAMNFRGCSGEMNRSISSYHSGISEDLAFVIDYIEQKKIYSEIVLVGFSLGGNVILKYLGERGGEGGGERSRERAGGGNIPSTITSAAVVSVPCCLKGSSQQLAKRNNQIYMKRFIHSLKKKMKIKSEIFPSELNYNIFQKVQTFQDFDDAYTAPYHGFIDAEDYWAQCSSKKYVADIKVPTLLINALDDPFLDEECFPFQAATHNPNLFLETPKYGGHVGFTTLGLKNEYWHETRIIQFVHEISGSKS